MEIFFKQRFDNHRDHRNRQKISKCAVAKLFKNIISKQLVDLIIRLMLLRFWYKSDKNQ